jgi:phenylacetate-CoA ligase
VKKQIIKRSTVNLKKQIYKILKKSGLYGKEKHNNHDQNLINIINYAYRNTNYYKELFDKNKIMSDKGFEISNFKQIPPLTKDIIRKNHEKLISSNYKGKVYWNTSGGTTGEPVKILQSKEYKRSVRGSLKAYEAQNFNFYQGDKSVILWGDEREILNGKKSIKAEAYNRLNNRIFLNSFRMNDLSMKSYIEIINREKPKLLTSYVQSLYELCMYAENNNLKITGAQNIIVTAGVLHPFMREKIEKICNTRIYNRYGSREVSFIAGEIPGEDGLIINERDIFIEILDDYDNECNEGEVGNVVVTSLSNYSMPLIRYKIGDRASKISEITGDGFVKYKLTNIKGRTVDVFMNIYNEKIDGEYFTHLFYDKASIQKFQLIQKELNKIEVKYQINNQVTYETLQKEKVSIQDGIKKVMGSECRVIFQEMDNVPTSSSGKFRYTISELNR